MSGAVALPDAASFRTKSVFLTFFDGAERYAVAIQDVDEIFEYETLRRIPGVPPMFLGLVDLRGHILTVLNLFPAGTDRPRVAVALRVPYRHLAVHIPFELESESFTSADEVREDDGEGGPVPGVRGVLRNAHMVYNVLSPERIADRARDVLIASFKSHESSPTPDDGGQASSEMTEQKGLL